MQRDDEGHQPPQADLHGRETSPASGRLSGASDGCRDQPGVFFVILFLPRRRGPAEFAALLGLFAGFWPALHYFELNLTSGDAPIYHYLGWGEAKLMLGHSFSRGSRKTNFLPSIFWSK